MRLKDRVVIVTGGARGIGRSYVQALAKEGARLVVADIADAGESVEEARSAGGEAVAVPTDVTDEDSTQAMAKAALDAFGRIDVLVNNAGIAGRFARVPVEEVTVELWDRVMAVNAKGMFLCAKAVLPAMRAQKSGRMINISSHTFYLGASGMIAYTTSKGTVLAFTRALARELGMTESPSTPWRPTSFRWMTIWNPCPSTSRSRFSPGVSSVRKNPKTCWERSSIWRATTAPSSPARPCWVNGGSYFQ